MWETVFRSSFFPRYSRFFIVALKELRKWLMNSKVVFKQLFSVQLVGTLKCSVFLCRLDVVFFEQDQMLVFHANLWLSDRPNR